MVTPFCQAPPSDHIQNPRTFAARPLCTVSACVGALALALAGCSSAEIVEEDVTAEDTSALAAESEEASPFTDATSTLVTGIANCMGSSMKCQSVLIRNS